MDTGEAVSYRQLALPAYPHHRHRLAARHHTEPLPKVAWMGTEPWPRPLDVKSSTSPLDPSMSTPRPLDADSRNSYALTASSPSTSRPLDPSTSVAQPLDPSTSDARPLEPLVL